MYSSGQISDCLYTSTVQVYKQRQASPGGLSALCVLTCSRRSSRLHRVANGVPHSFIKSLKGSLGLGDAFSFPRELQGLRHRLLLPACSACAGTRGLPQRPWGAEAALACSSKSPQQKPFAAFSARYRKVLQGWAKEVKEF